LLWAVAAPVVESAVPMVSAVARHKAVPLDRIVPVAKLTNRPSVDIAARARSNFILLV
jgi:hypothetical protein